MATGSDRSKRPRRLGILFALILLAAVVALAIHLHDGGKPNGSMASDSSATSSVPGEVAFTNLVRVNDRLHLPDRPTAFTGIAVEHYPDGTLRSRTAVVDGVVDGRSEGWHPNGQLQISEHFATGLSHGVRTKWYASGAKLSEARFVKGKLHGPFRRWHENGQLSEKIDYLEGEPDGVSRAWFPSGRLKARVVLQSGQPIEQQFWSDAGETRDILHRR
jgi:antitoxin component YwqK of YwqJK toxin-antitoxin module